MGSALRGTGESTARFPDRTPTGAPSQNSASHYLHDDSSYRKPSVEVLVPDYYVTQSQRNNRPLKMDIDGPGVTKARRPVAGMDPVSKALLSTSQQHFRSKHDPNVVYVNSEISATDAVVSRVRADPLICVRKK